MTFELITEEFGLAVAAIIPDKLTRDQLGQFYIINGLLPEAVENQPELASRWHVSQVLATAEWARAQLRRRPMFRPRGIKLQFL